LQISTSKPFGGIVAAMEFNLNMAVLSQTRLSLVALAASFFLLVGSLSAETYRWKDKEGKTHYGATVPAEYADRPYDILNNAGLVIQHVEDTRTPIEEVIEELVKGREPLISDEQRQVQSDRLLVIQYRTEEDIGKALEAELAQLGYDRKIIGQSYDSASFAIRDQIRLAADQQRAGLPLNEDQQKLLNKLYQRLGRDQKRIAGLESREIRIRARFKTDLERYQFLSAENEDTEASAENETEQGDQG
jgi:hypothetical protein